MIAVAYMNHGRWCCDCPRPYCNNAMELQPKETMFHCQGGCNLIAEIEWPTDAEEITEALTFRPVPATRNWAPAGHRQALATGFPDGQTVADLYAETAEYAIAIDGGQ